MPVPKPHAGESQSDFVSRCMGDDAMQEYDQEQRAAICYRTFRDDANKDKSPIGLASKDYGHSHVMVGGVDDLGPGSSASSGDPGSPAAGQPGTQISPPLVMGGDTDKDFGGGTSSLAPDAAPPILEPASPRDEAGQSGLLSAAKPTDVVKDDGVGAPVASGQDRVIPTTDNPPQGRGTVVQIPAGPAVGPTPIPPPPGGDIGGAQTPVESAAKPTMEKDEAALGPMPKPVVIMPTGATGGPSLDPSQSGPAAPRPAPVTPSGGGIYDDEGKAAKAAGLGTPLKLFGRIEKVVPLEDGTVEVHGIASTEARDDQNEIVRHTAMAAAIPGYLKFPAIREMHDTKAAGRALEIGVDPTTRNTNIVAHIVDPVAVTKIKHKVYNGFSIGGHVTERDPSDKSIITGLKLHEVSLVDRPANPEAVIECWKLGGTEMPDGGLGTLGDLLGDALAEAMKKQSPPQLWWCGNAEHQHVKKDDAQKCMAQREHAAKVAADEIEIPDPETGEPIMVKRSDPRAIALATGEDPARLALKAATEAAQRAARQLLAKDVGPGKDWNPHQPAVPGAAPGFSSPNETGPTVKPIAPAPSSDAGGGSDEMAAASDGKKPFPGAAEPFKTEKDEGGILGGTSFAEGSGGGMAPVGTPDPGPSPESAQYNHDHPADPGVTVMNTRSPLPQHSGGGVALYTSSDSNAPRINAARPTTIKAGDKPYGDVEYADPGYQEDGKKRYPIDTEDHIRAAWSYIGQDKNQKQYTSDQVSRIKAKIVAAWKSKIDKDGPPGASDDKVLRMIKALTDTGRIASMIVELKWLQTMLSAERGGEDDDSKIPDNLGDIVQQMCDFLTALVAEETAEVLDGEDMPFGCPMPAPYYGPMLWASHITDLAKFLPTIQPPEGAEPITVARCIIAKANAPKLTEFVEAYSKGQPEMMTLEEAAEPLRLVKTLKFILDQPSAHPAEVYWTVADMHDDMIGIIERAGVKVPPELKECAGKKPSAADQELMNMAHYAAYKAWEMSDSDAKKAQLGEFMNKMESVGAQRLPEQQVPDKTLPAEGSPEANATQDTGRNAATSAPMGDPNPPAGTAGGPEANATQDTRDNARTTPPMGVSLAMASMIDGLAKRSGTTAAQVMTDMAHDCVQKLTDDVYCLPAREDAMQHPDRGAASEMSPPRFAQKKSVRFSAKTLKTLGDAHGCITKAGAKCNAGGMVAPRGNATTGEPRDEASVMPTHKVGGEAADLLKAIRENTELLNAYVQENRGLKDEVKKLRETPLPPVTSQLPEGLVMVDKTVETNIAKNGAGPDAHIDPIAGFQGTGPNGAVTPADVTKFLAALPDETRTLMLIRASHALPKKVGGA